MAQMNVVVWDDPRVIAFLEDVLKLDTTMLQSYTIEGSINDAVRVTSTRIAGFQEKDKTELEKPPLGIIPEYLWKEERLQHLKECVERCSKIEWTPEPTWLKEIEKLEEELKQHLYPSASAKNFVDKSVMVKHFKEECKNIKEEKGIYERTCNRGFMCKYVSVINPLNDMQEPAYSCNKYKVALTMLEDSCIPAYGACPGNLEISNNEN